MTTVNTFVNVFYKWLIWFRVKTARFLRRIADVFEEDDWGLDEALRTAAVQAVQEVEVKYAEQRVTGIYRRTRALLILSNTAPRYREREWDCAVDWALKYKKNR